jgi:hypothetical protein
MRTDGCTCPGVTAGSYRTGSRSWSDRCPVHGVGTEYFQQLENLPFGWMDDARAITREEYLAFLAREGADEAARAAESYDATPTVCMTHLRFIPCRKSGGHYYSSDPQDVTRVLHHHSATQGE